MSPHLRKSLRRILLDRPERPTGPVSVRAWMEENGISRDHAFDTRSFDRLETLLRAEGMDPYAIPTGTSRAASWLATGDDKVDAGPVGAGHVLIRAVPGRTLKLEENLAIPGGASMRLTLHELVRANRHQSVMLVENQEVFDRIEHLRFVPDCWSEDPLIVFRGSRWMGMAGARVGETMVVPVHVFSDIDPSGVQIAASTQGCVGMVLPPPSIIADLASHSRNADRFRAQLAHVGDLANDPRPWVKNAFALITRLGCMVPQEALLTEHST